MLNSNKVVNSALVMIWFLMISMMTTSTGFSQVVISSLDPTEPVIMPAAAAWREKMIIGARYREQNGTRSLNDSQIYQFDVNGYSASAAFRISNFVLEGYFGQNKNSVKLDQYYDGRINLNDNDNRLFVALSGNDFVTLGLGGQVKESKDFFDATFDAATTTQAITVGSLSIGIMDIFYLGAGFERVKESSSYAVDINWNNVTGGAALRIGDPGSTRFRCEYSVSYSPEYENEVQGNLMESVHHETTRSRLAAEVMFSGLLFAVKGEESKIKIGPPSSQVYQQVEEIVKKQSQVGVLWIPETGLVLGFYFATENTSYFFEDEMSAFSINLGYVF